MGTSVVLMFEPDSTRRSLLRGSLEGVNAAVVVAEDAVSFLRELRRHDPELAILPDDAGAGEVAGWIESVREHAPACRVILLGSASSPPPSSLQAVYDFIAIADPFPAAAVNAAVARALGSVAPNSGLVLVVEDSRVNLDLVADVLHAKRYRVQRAGTAEEGIAIANVVAPDVVLMDIYLPGMNGVDAVRALKEAEKTSPIPIVMLSANGSEATVADALEAGAIDFVVKPFSPRALLEKVGWVLQKREILTHA